jgi:signal transduction histidine kinase
VWDGDDLLLVRRVVRDGGEALQGMVLDREALRGWLLAEVADLLPAAALEPVRPGEPADPGRRRALLPLRLEPGSPPVVVGGGVSPARMGLGTAATAVALTVLAAALLLGAGLRLARRQTEFASAVIHELRSPLTSFRLYTDMLADDMVPPAERPQTLETLRGEAERLGRLVENVLAYARLERRSAGAAGGAVEQVELAPLLRRAAERLAHREAGDGLELRLELAPEVEGLRVRADPLAVERILENLCDNSCRHGRRQDEPAAEAGSGAAGEAAAPADAPAAVTVELTAALRGRHAVVRWSDRGPGVPRSARRRLFRPFHRAPAAGTGAGSGIGLGLALSRRLARGFGGDLRHLDPPGGGAAFELWLPRVG